MPVLRLPKAVRSRRRPLGAWSTVTVATIVSPNRPPRLAANSPLPRPLALDQPQIEIGLVEVGEALQAFPVEYLGPALMEGQQARCPELLEAAVEVDVGHAGEVGQL